MNAPMLVLGMISVMIILSGVAFGIYSIIYRTSFQVLNADIPGYIFGAVAVFLGIRYIKAVIAFYRSIKNSGSVFSWRNFVKTVN
jgi:phosphoglycerol transferase MdoB-like AlkP superfamily enzyme